MVGEAVELEEAEDDPELEDVPEPDAPPYVPRVVASATKYFTQGHKMVSTPVQGNPRLSENPGTTWLEGLSENPGTTWLEHPFKGTRDLVKTLAQHG